MGSGLNANSEHRTQAPLPVIHVGGLEASKAGVLTAGGTITREIFAFPGGRRFHFLDPAGNELAAWSEGISDGAAGMRTGWQPSPRG